MKFYSAIDGLLSMSKMETGNNPPLIKAYNVLSVLNLSVLVQVIVSFLAIRLTAVRIHED